MTNWDDGRWQYMERNGERWRHTPWVDMTWDVDLGCGRLKKGRVGVDQYPDPGVDVVLDLNDGWLPFDTSSIQSIISHHCLEHVGTGFMPLMDEIYRVLVPDGLFYAITPLFPSRVAVEDPTHVRYFMQQTWASFCGHLGDENNPTGCWCDSFSTPYTKCRFKMLDQQISPDPQPDDLWGQAGACEIRVVLSAVKHADVTADRNP